MKPNTEAFYDYIEDNKMDLVLSLWENENYKLRELIDKVLSINENVFDFIVEEMEKDPKMSQELDRLVEQEALKHCGSICDREDLL